jgi:hypothetical protein
MKMSTLLTAKAGQMQRTSEEPSRAFYTSGFPSERETLRELLHVRTRELAVLAGRRSIDVTKPDYEQAKRELTGETLPELQNAILDAVPPLYSSSQK